MTQVGFDFFQINAFLFIEIKSYAEFLLPKLVLSQMQFLTTRPHLIGFLDSSYSNFVNTGCFNWQQPAKPLHNGTVCSETESNKNNLKHEEKDPDYITTQISVLRSFARPQADGKLKTLQIYWIFLGISFIVALVTRSCRSYVVLPWENINFESPRLFILIIYEQTVT